MQEPLPKDLETTLDRELEALRSAESDEGVSVDLLRFTGAVLRAQASAQAKVRSIESSDEEGSTGSSPPEIGASIELSRVRFDRSILQELLGSLEEASGDDKEEKSSVQVMARAAREKPELLESIVRASLPGGDARVLAEAGRELEVPVEALMLVGRLLASPFVREARIERGPPAPVDARDAPGREAGTCPTCGSLPALAVLETEDGSRRLMCSLCGEVWRAPRLMCTSCGNRDQSKLGTLYLDEADARWIEICDVCRRYLKTVDERRLPSGEVPMLRAEDARTVHLDMIAEEEGFVRSTY